MLQIIINSILISSIYILISLPFLLYSRYFGWINFGIGGLFVLPGISLWYFQKTLQIEIFPSLLFSFIITVLFTSLIHWFLGLLERKGDSINILIMSLVILDVLQNLILLFFGSNVKILNLSNTQFQFPNANFNLLNVVSIIISIVVFCFILYLSEISNLGLKLKGMASSLTIFQSGIGNPKIFKIIVLATIVICVWLSGLILSAEYSISFSIIGYGIKGWIISVLADIKIKKLAIVCILISFSESLLVLILPTGFKDVILYLLMLLYIISTKSQYLYGKLSY
jgi:branched-chain amino acid transport system permease protein